MATSSLFLGFIQNDSVLGTRLHVQRLAVETRRGQENRHKQEINYIMKENSCRAMGKRK
jgi:hypothetical protein